MPSGRLKRGDYTLAELLARRTEMRYCEEFKNVVAGFNLDHYRQTRFIRRYRNICLIIYNSSGIRTEKYYSDIQVFTVSNHKNNESKTNRGYM